MQQLAGRNSPGWPSNVPDAHSVAQLLSSMAPASDVKTATRCWKVAALASPRRGQEAQRRRPLRLTRRCVDDPHAMLHNKPQVSRKS
jgi:hypothetical protein